jgi:hypothetical protein
MTANRSSGAEPMVLAVEVAAQESLGGQLVEQASGTGRRDIGQQGCGWCRQSQIRPNEELVPDSQRVGGDRSGVGDHERILAQHVSASASR